MAINARTFQLLYIIRQRALDDDETRLGDISTFINDRRSCAPSLYEKAYIAPSAIRDMVQRMTTVEGLLTLSDEGYLELTVKGSQMADLLSQIDACSSLFLDNYKEQVCLAALQQCQRLGTAPVTPREVAALANISLDSARRGLATAHERGDIIEDRSDRTPVYSLPTPTNTNINPVSGDGPGIPRDGTDFITDGEDGITTPGGLDNPAEEGEGFVDPVNPVAAALAGINDDDDLLPGETELQPREPVDDEDILFLGRILQDDDEVDDDEIDDDEGNVIDEDRLMARLSMAGALPADASPEADEPVPVEMFHEWANVPLNVQNIYMSMARASGMSLQVFLRRLLDRLQQDVRESLRIGF